MRNIQTDIDNQIVVNITSGNTSLEDILSHIEQNIDSWSDKNVIWDLSNFDFHDITSDSLALFIQKSRRHLDKRKGLKTAVVAKTDLGYGMMRMYSVMAKMNSKFQIKVRPFRSLSEAKEWMNS